MMFQVQRGFFFEFPKMLNISLLARVYHSAMECVVAKIIKQYEEDISLIELSCTKNIQKYKFLHVLKEFIFIFFESCKEIVYIYAKMLFEIHNKKTVS